MQRLVARFAVVLFLAVLLIGSGPTQLGVLHPAVPPGSRTWVVEGNSSDARGQTSACIGCMTHNISVCDRPSGTAFDPQNQYLYVDCSGYNHTASGGIGNAVDVISTLNDSLVTEVRIAPSSAAVLPSGPSTQTPLPVPPPPPPSWEGVAYDDANGDIYAASPCTQNVTVINGSSNTAVDSIPVTGVPVGLAIDGNNGDIYVTTFAVSNQIYVTSNVSVISGTNNTVIGNFTLPGELTSVQFDPVNNHLYFSNARPNELSVVDAVTYQVVSTLAVNSNEGIGYDPVTGDLYVGGEDGNFTGMLTVINSSSNTVSHILWLAANLPTDVAYDSLDQKMLVALTDVDNGSLLVVSPRDYTEMGRIEVTGCPSGVWYDPGNDAAYVAAGCTNNMTVVNPNLASYLSSVLVNPGNASIEPTAVVTFAATPSCSAGPCPASIVYSWSINNSQGIVSPTLGATASFFAGNKPGEVSVEVTASLGGVNKSDRVHVIILANPGGPSSKGSWYSPTLLDLFTDLELALAGGVIVVIALLIVAISTRGKSSHRPKSGER